MKAFLKIKPGGFAVRVDGVGGGLVLQAEIADGVVDVCVMGGLVEEFTPRADCADEFPGFGQLPGLFNLRVFITGQGENLRSGDYSA